MMFLLGRQAMFGQEPPTNFRSTSAVRWPSFDRVHARYLPASPLPITRTSQCSVADTFFSYVQRAGGLDLSGTRSLANSACSAKCDNIERTDPRLLRLRRLDREHVRCTERSRL